MKTSSRHVFAFLTVLAVAPRKGCASFVLHSSSGASVVLVEDTYARSSYFGPIPTETFTPSRRNLPVTYVDDVSMTTFCRAFENDEVILNHANHLIVFMDESDYTCSGSLGTTSNQRFLEKWCQLNATIMQVSRSYFFRYFFNPPPDRFRGMLDGPAGEAVASCFWGRGRLSESSEATEALKLLSINSTEYVGDLALTWHRFQRPLPWLIWMGLVGITFWAIAAAGARTLHYRLYRTRNWSSEHIVILFINVSSALVLGTLRFLSATWEISMSSELFVYQDFFTLGVATSVLLISVYSRFLTKVRVRERDRELQRVMVAIFAFILVVIEIGIDSAAIQTDTGNAHYIVDLLPFIMIIVQLLTIIKLWSMTMEVAGTLQSSRGSIAFSRIALHLKFWIRVSIVAAVSSIVTLVLVATGLMGSYYAPLRGLFEFSKCLSLYAEMMACSSLQKPRYPSRRRIGKSIRRSFFGVLRGKSSLRTQPLNTATQSERVLTIDQETLQSNDETS